MKTAILKSAEEITGVSECESFSTINTDYTVSMNEIALAGKRIEIELVKDGGYDYAFCDPNEKDCFWRVCKSWLKDIQEEIDWSKVPVDTKVIVSNSPHFSHSRSRYFAAYKNGRCYCYPSGATSWSNDHPGFTPWDYIMLAEDTEQAPKCVFSYNNDRGKYESSCGNSYLLGFKFCPNCARKVIYKDAEY